MSPVYSPTQARMNLFLNVLTIFLGITAFLYKANYEGSAVSCLREMTCDGTLFAVLVAAIISVQRILELTRKKSLPSRVCYFLHLSSAVTEALILMVVLIGLLPFVKDKPVFARYDMINMHVIVPLITMFSFVRYACYPGELKPRDRLNGLIFIILYAVTMITLILLNVVPEEKIPYSFLNVRKAATWYLVVAGLAAATISMFFSTLFTDLNQRRHRTTKAS